MAINTQGTLITAVEAWLSRTDLTAKIPDFIVLAESKLNRDLRDLAQETKVTNVSISAEYVNVPTGFLAVKSFETTTGGKRYSLKLLPDETATDRYPDTGIPLYYSIVGAQFRFTPVPNATYTSVLVYYAVITPLATTSGNTNFALTTYTDLYLYAVCFEACVYVKDIEAAQGYKALYESELVRVQNAAKRNRWSGPGLVQRPG